MPSSPRSSAATVATSAVVTAVVGLSLQATLGNVVGGISLQLDDSINEGDWVELESKAQGQIKKIRWRHTVIETRDWDTLIVPNGQLMTQAFRVLGKRSGKPLQRRMWVYFNVDFRFPPGEIVRVVNDALQAAPIDGVASDPKAHCICYDLARDNRDSFAYYAVRYWLTDLARDDKTGRLYAATDFNVLVQKGNSGKWQLAASGMPMVEVPALTIVPGSRLLYAASHGLGAWVLNLPKVDKHH